MIWKLAVNDSSLQEILTRDEFFCFPFLFYSSGDYDLEHISNEFMGKSEEVQRKEQRKNAYVKLGQNTELQQVWEIGKS